MEKNIKNNNLKQQIKILKKRRYEKFQGRALKPKRDQILLLKKLLFNKKKLVYGTIFFIVLQVILEIILIVYGRHYVDNTISIKPTILLIAGFSILYLLVSYQAINYEKTLIVLLINDLRLKWFKLFMSRRVYNNDLEQKSSLIAKISYHLPLLSSGLANSVIGIVKVITLLTILLAISLIFSWRLLWIFLLIIIGAMITLFAGFIISREYVIKETTYYTQIIKLMDFSLSDWHFTKYFHRENSIIKEFNKLVDLDSHFRVKRNLWMRFSSSFVFIALIFIVLAINQNSQAIGQFFINSQQSFQFMTAIFIIYTSRILYTSLRAGLYSVPTLLGIKLSVPERKSLSLSVGKKLKTLSINLKSPKLKIFRYGDYHKNIEFDFKAGGRYLITGKERSGKSSLARTIVGQAEYGRRAWIIKYKNKRFFYNDFYQSFSGFYYIDPNFKSSRSVLEIALGLEKKLIKDQDFLKIVKIIEKNQILQGLFFARHDWRLKADKELNNPKDKLLLQVLYCLWSKPALITIDNYWLDIQDDEFITIIKLLEKSLPESIIISFSKRKISNDYNFIYEI